MITALLNHLWQSSLFAAFAALLTLLLRRHPARLRFSVWLAASLKFALPFALLAMLGNHLAWRPPTSLPEPQPLQALAQPFAATVVIATPPAALPARPAPAPSWPLLLAAVWLAGAITVLAIWLLRWSRLRRTVAAAPSGPACGSALPVRWTGTAIEPGVFGVFRPVLLLPTGIAGRLRPEQLDALIAHELCHARRRDNLWATLHMAIAAAFWFFPPVWWIGNRLIAERERACDEAVLAAGADPGAYAEAVLQVCRDYIAAPLACTAGVTGADLKRRVADIMTFAGNRTLAGTAKLALAALLASVIAAPLVAGRLYAPWQQKTELSASTLSFDVASVKPRPAAPASGTVGVTIPSPGRLVANCASLKVLVGYAYRRTDHPYQDVLGGPPWSDSACGDSAGTFNLEATMPPATTVEQARQMMQSLLVARFQLHLHLETRQERVFALRVLPGGLKLPASDPAKDPAIPPHSMACPADDSRCHMFTPGSISMSFVAWLSRRYTGRPVMDKTGLPGDYFNNDYRYRGNDSPGSSLPTFEELLKGWGLELKPEMGPVDYLVIDHAEMPTGN